MKDNDTGPYTAATYTYRPDQLAAIWQEAKDRGMNKSAFMRLVFDEWLRQMAKDAGLDDLMEGVEA